MDLLGMVDGVVFGMYQELKAKAAKIRKLIVMDVHQEKLMLPQITIDSKKNFYKAFTSPHCDIEAKIYNAAGEQVGTASYTESPLFDRIYLFNVDIYADHRRKGYATALLWYLAQSYKQSITPVKELYDAGCFWTAARKLSEIGIVITEHLSMCDMDKEASRWGHLQPQSVYLERLISERLMNHLESWETAVGRGLPESN